MQAQSTPTISDLYFGKDDAESDISAGGLLERGFLPTPTFDAVSNRRKTLIIGRKGSGKSAICVVLDRRRQQGQVQYNLVTPDEISAEEVRRFELPGIKGPQAKVLLWRYVLGVQIAKFMLAAARRGDEALPDSLKPVRKFLVDNKEVDDLRFTEKLWRVIEKLRGSLSLEAFGVKVAAEVAAPPTEGVRVSHQLDAVEQALLIAYQSTAWVNGAPSIILMVDQLERVWANDRDSDEMVVGLLIASKQLAAFFKFATVTLFLRTDIYEFLIFPDRDKYRGEELRIDWSRQDLERLVLARASASLGSEVTENQLWNQLFPRTVSGRRTKDFLLDHTLLRPRDVIQFCNLCRDTAEKNGHRVIEQQDILEATPQYSAWKLRDLIAEYSVNYPFLNDLFVLFQNNSYVMTRRGLDARLRTVRDALSKRFPDHSGAFEVDGILDVLYGIGFLGVVRPTGPAYVFAGALAVGPGDDTFVVHPAFRDALRSTSSLDLRPLDLDRLRRRVTAGTFDVGITTPVRRGSLGSREASFVADRCRRIDEAFIKSNLPDDVKEEVRHNFGEVYRVCESLSYESEDVVPELVVEVIGHLQSLREALRGCDLINENERVRLYRHVGDTMDDLVRTRGYWLGPGNIAPA